MRGAVIFIFVLTTAVIGFFGFSGVVAPVAEGAIVWVPAIFTISLIIGFASRWQTWFH
jgi:uncharacterized membrane protein YtjA (UPF0391 family)